VKTTRRDGIWTVVLPALCLMATACGGGTGGDDEGPTNIEWEGATETPVVLNEVDIKGRDWVELHNPSDEAADVGLWLLSDDPTRDSHRYRLPEGTTIPAKGHLVVRSEKDEGDGTGFPFGLKTGETVTLLHPGGGEVRSVTIGPVPDGRTWGRVPDGRGPWQVTVPTQGGENEGLWDLDTVLFDPRSVARVEIDLSDEAKRSLDDEPSAWVEGDVRFLRDGDVLAECRSGVRLKGGRSFRPLDDKPAFKLKFDHVDEDARLMGLVRLTLNNMVQDPTFVRETLAYRVFRDEGVPAARTGYAEVVVSGEEYGLYLTVEPYDELFFNGWFSDTRHLYEGTRDLFPGDAALFDVDDGPEDDRADLEALIRTVNEADAASFVAQVSAVLDLDAMVRLWAVEVLTGHRDGYAKAGNNYYLHSDRRLGTPTGILACDRSRPPGRLRVGQLPNHSMAPRSRPPAGS